MKPSGEEERGSGRFSPEQIQQVIQSAGIKPTTWMSAEAIAAKLLEWEGRPKRQIKRAQKLSQRSRRTSTQQYGDCRWAED